MTSDMEKNAPEPTTEPVEHGGNGGADFRGHVRPYKLRRKKAPKAAPSGRVAANSPWVSSEFIRPNAARLDVNLKELGEAMGLSKGVVSKYVREGTCPLWFRLAMNGLLAEQELAVTEHRPIQRLPELSQELTHGRSDEGLIVLHLKPEELLAAKALIGMLGWKTLMRQED